MIERSMMDSRECYRWTLSEIVLAFLELVLAYCLLCGSALVFLSSKFLLMFGLYIPCPCSGILGYKNKDICLRKLLFELPLRKVYTIQKLSMDRLPYEIVWHQEHEEILMGISDGKKENNVVKMGYRKGSSSGSDVRTKQSMDHKQKVTGRRRRGKSSLVLSTSNTHLSLVDASSSGNNTQVMKIEDNDIQEEFNVESPKNVDDIRDNSSSVKKALMHNDVDIVKRLEGALREERAARAALVVELEEERAAAATAADEAMAMILRLHADKASLEMEAKQYERMMEEKFAYDEEEMTILKEILVRREKEKHFLEKELEAYKQINDELPKEDFNGHDYPFASSEGNGTPRDSLMAAQKDQTRDSIEKNLAFRKPKMNSHDDGSLPEKEPIMYDVHVVEDNSKFHDSKMKDYEEIDGSDNSRDYKNNERARMKLMEEIEIVKDE